MTQSPVRVSASSLSKRYGGVTALKSVSLELQGPCVSGFIGPNGSGKTTFFDVACGFIQPDSGRFGVDGVDVTGWTAAKRGASQLGFARTFQVPRLCDGLTVLENAAAGFFVGEHEGFFPLALRPWSWRAAIVASIELARFHLAQVSLDGQEKRLARELSFGQRKRLELARALASGARCLWLDEPFAGIEGRLVDRLAGRIRSLVLERRAVACIIEHRFEPVRLISDRIFEFRTGTLTEARRP